MPDTISMPEFGKQRKKIVYFLMQKYGGILHWVCTKTQDSSQPMNYRKYYTNFWMYWIFYAIKYSMTLRYFSLTLSSPFPMLTHPNNHCEDIPLALGNSLIEVIKKLHFRSMSVRAFFGMVESVRTIRAKFSNWKIIIPLYGTQNIRSFENFGWNLCVRPGICRSHSVVFKSTIKNTY